MEDGGETYYQSFLEGLSSKQVQNTDTESEDRILELVKLEALIWDEQPVQKSRERVAELQRYLTCSIA